MTEQPIFNETEASSAGLKDWNGIRSPGHIKNLSDYVVSQLGPPLHGTVAQRSPRQMAITALQSASDFLGVLVTDGHVSSDAARVIATIDESLQNLNAELAGLEEHKPLGPITSTIRQRSLENERTLERYARMVIAVKWLEMLRENSLRPGQAMSMVGRAMCGSESEIDAWIEQFKRPNSRRRQDTVYRMWQELKRSYRESGCSMADETPETVLRWMKEESLPILAV